MHSGGGAMSLLFNNFFVNSVFPNLSVQRQALKKDALVKHSFSIVVSKNIALLFTPKTIYQDI